MVNAEPSHQTAAWPHQGLLSKWIACSMIIIARNATFSGYMSVILEITILCAIESLRPRWDTADVSVPEWEFWVVPPIGTPRAKIRVSRVRIRSRSRSRAAVRALG